MSDILYDAEHRRKTFVGSELDFIRMEISLAFTFLDRADTTESPEVRNRNRENAQKAHDEAASRIVGHSFENTANAKTRKLLSWYSELDYRPITEATPPGVSQTLYAMN